jgi:hypothetical protein
VRALGLWNEGWTNIASSSIAGASSSWYCHGDVGLVLSSSKRMLRLGDLIYVSQFLCCLCLVLGVLGNVVLSGLSEIRGGLIGPFSDM